MPSMPSEPFVPLVLTINYPGLWDNLPRTQRLKLDLQSPITFDDLLGEMWEPFSLTHRSQPKSFRATPGSLGGRPYQPPEITNNEELQAFLVSMNEEDELLLQTAWHDKTFIKLGVHPCYGTTSLQPRATMQDLVDAGQALYGNKTPGELAEVYLVDGDKFLHIPDEVAWRTFVLPLLKDDKRDIRQALTFHLGPLGPQPLSAPALSQLSSSFGTLSLFSPTPSKTLSTVDSSADHDGASTAGSEGTVQF